MVLGFIILGCILLGIAIYLYVRYCKRLKIDNVYFVSGGVKTGKTFVSVALAIKTYKKNVRHWYLSCVLYGLLYLFTRHPRFKDETKKPMLYSNIPLRYVKYNPLTIDIIERKVRIPNKSVVLIDETSLLADSMLFKDKTINDELMLFYKLFAHYTHGGTCIANSQAIADNHYSLKRCMSHYLYINKRTKYPFISLFNVREMIYSADGSAINSVTGDIELSCMVIFFLNKYYKYYDCYCYSIFTDSLSYYVDYDKKVLGKLDSLKTDNLVTLQNFETLDRRTFARRQLQAKKNFAKGNMKND